MSMQIKNDNPKIESIQCENDNPKIESIQCENFAPYFAIKSTTSDKKFSVWQGNCNSWTCPRCGQLRAKKEYGRIVNGCRILASDDQLYFVTLTCRGAGLSVSEADENYLKWTNKILTAMRTQAKRAGNPWHYVQVTERQKRGHPHSHILTTWYPKDLRDGQVEKWRTNQQTGSMEKYFVDALRSDWLQKQSIKSGLGEQYDISIVQSEEAASRYVAKYLFKDSMFSTQWAKNWRRVRYSQSFPKLPEQSSDRIVTALIHKDDWQALAKKALIINIEEGEDYIHISRMLGKSDTLLKINRKVSQEDDS